MNNINISKDNAFVEFVKRFGYYIIAGVMVVAIGLTLAIMGGTPTVIDDPGENVSGGTITFTSPLAVLELLKGFSNTDLMYNATLNQWEAHKAVDLKGTESDVFAVLDGTVKNVYTTHLEGTVVVIEHTAGLQTAYGSLANSVSLKAGDLVKKGDKIGVTSSSAGSALDLGDHLSFEVYKDGAKVDPNSYIEITNK
ncbi:MAG: M23 family metallopeptidase [Clostridia bacterium]